MEIYALILASGSGSRAGLAIPKQFYKIESKTMLEYSVSAFQSHSLINKIIVVSNPDFMDLTKSAVRSFSKVAGVIPGGKTRQESSYKGLLQINNTNARVLIHDSARPFVSEKIISDCINALDKYSAVNVAVSSADTIMQIDNNNIITNVLDRSGLIRCQTPQCFDYSVIKKAHELAVKDKFTATDDIGLVLKYKLAGIYAVQGSEKNIKITYPLDLKIAECIYKELYG